MRSYCLRSEHAKQPLYTEKAIAGAMAGELHLHGEHLVPSCSSILPGFKVVLNCKKDPSKQLLSSYIGSALHYETHEKLLKLESFGKPKKCGFEQLLSLNALS